MNAIKNFMQDEEGAAAVEYGLLVALIAVAIAAAVGVVGTNLSALFTRVSTCLASPSAANCIP